MALGVHSRIVRTNYSPRESCHARAKYDPAPSGLLHSWNAQLAEKIGTAAVRPPCPFKVQYIDFSDVLHTMRTHGRARCEFIASLLVKLMVKVC